MNTYRMMNRYRKTKAVASLFGLLLIMGLTSNATAQESPTLSFVRHNYDLFSESMGVGAGASYGRTHYIYTSPTSIFRNDVKGITASWTTKYLPNEEIGPDTGRSVYNALSLGWRIKQHAILVGARYAHSPKILTSNHYGDGRMLTPRDLSVDLGYAVQISDAWSAYAIGHFVMSQINKIAYTGGGSIGVGYAPQAINGVVPTHWSLALRNVGGLVQYGKAGGKYRMPGSVTFSGDAAYQLCSDWLLQGMVSADYVLQPLKSKVYTAGGGLSLTYHKGLSMRLGGAFTNHMSYLSMGVGYHLLERIDLNLSYRLCTQDRAFNQFGVGLSFDLGKARDTSKPFVY